MKKSLAISALIAFFVLKCSESQLPTPPSPITSDVVLTWNEAILSAVREAQTSPPEAARAMAMTHIALYDAMNSVTPTFAPLRASLSVTEPASAEAAGSFAAHAILISLYPAQKAKWDEILSLSVRQVDEAQKVKSQAVGEAIAANVIAWRKNDVTIGARIPPIRPMVPPGSPGAWKKTSDKDFLLPGWGQVAPFGLTSTTRLRKDGPPRLDTERWRMDVGQVRALGGKNSTVRSAEETEIARFWEDGPGTSCPPGHWNLIARQVIVNLESKMQQHFTTLERARAFALMNMSLADAAIVAWDMKWHYYFWRPITAIREAFVYGERPDPTWEALLPIPNFPDYVSGHSTFSGAAARMLQHLFRGANVSFTISSEGMPNVSRTFGSVWAAADEAGRSRIYGGIHYQSANQDGLAAGAEIADEIHLRFNQRIGRR